jgi:RNA 3'-terminal phosphate cyclase (ATP)
VDEHLADQLLLPAVLASDESQYRVAEVSTNLTTNGAIIAQFGLAQITLDEEEKIVVVKPGDR